VDALKVDELVSSLQTYEPTLPQSKKKHWALRSSRKEKEVVEYFDEKVLSMLTRKFCRHLRTSKGSNRISSANSSKCDSREVTCGKSSRPRRDKNTNGVQYFECHNFGHIRTMYLEKSKGNAMNACLNDEFESDHNIVASDHNIIQGL
jgi:hypothetical protein